MSGPLALNRLLSLTMVGSENPYQPPADVEEPQKEVIDDNDELDLRSIAISLSLIVVFVVAVVVMHSLSAGLGVALLTLAVLSIVIFAAFTVAKLIEMFQRF